ncbi:MAG: ABC transporter permease [Candidatus Asgardarchaeia archaeon]
MSSHSFNTIYAMWYRQIIRFSRNKSRVIGTIVQPLLWIFFFGIGFSRMLSSGNAPTNLPGGVDYLTFLIPGIVMMTIFTASFMSGISIIWDRELGYLKEVLVAPASRKATIFGRTLGDATIAVLQGIVILLLVFPLTPTINLINLPFTLLYGFLMSISFAGIGIIMATRMRSMEGFQLIMNLIMMPLLFLSGVFYPPEVLPEWMQYVVFLNPLTYATDASRNLLLGFGSLPLWVDTIVLLVIASVFLVVAAVMFEKTSEG